MKVKPKSEVSKLNKEAAYILNHEEVPYTVKIKLRAGQRKVKGNQVLLNTLLDQINDYLIELELPRDLDQDHINLHNIGITRLPEDSIKKFIRYSEADTLMLGDNGITNLHASFGKFSDVAVIDLHDNQLTTLPESFGDLKKLKELNLEGNPITKLPKSFKKLKSLKEVRLPGSLLTSLVK